MPKQELFLIRGLPGSGKSTLARNLCYAFSSGPNYYPWVHIEADMYFERIGTYLFVPSELRKAHAWCQDQVEDSLENGYSCVVSNTFSRIWEMQPYLDMAKEFNCKLTVITCEGQYENTHNVPQETVNEMKQRWERYPS